MGSCIEIPRCVNLNPQLSAGDQAKLNLAISNTCDYDIVVMLTIKNREGETLQNLTVELNASSEKQVEIAIGSPQPLVISGNWSVKGTTLKIPLEEIQVGS
uniref:Uncharacterized protein n=1 Tax=Ignisphaera aggregans TaxID=334771 RepID=A0A7C2VLT2_9CREN